jgi:hypothetical protein
MHADGVDPASSVNRIEQDRLSTADAEQQKLGRRLDKKLNICRGC